jgi:hypothetical protein
MILPKIFDVIALQTTTSPDLVGSAQPHVPLNFGLAGLGEAIAVTAGNQPTGTRGILFTQRRLSSLHYCSCMSIPQSEGGAAVINLCLNATYIKPDGTPTPSNNGGGPAPSMGPRMIATRNMLQLGQPVLSVRPVEQRL